LWFTLVIPGDRLNDVASIVPIGPCEGPTKFSASDPAGQYIFRVRDVGICHVTVSFLSGAPDFVSDVQIGYLSMCCHTPAAQTSVVYVPEIGSVDGGADGRIYGDASDDTPG
jgi:hypothetical protein